MSFNYKFLATQLGESIKYDSTVNKINRVFLSLTNLKYSEYINSAITSIRSQTAYSWVLTIGDSSLRESGKISLIRQAIENLVINEDSKLKLLGLLPRDLPNKKRLPVKTGGRNYIDRVRIKELRGIKSDKFDFSKLIRLCEELNLAFSNKSYLSIAMLTRAILDHIPPVFGLKDFSQVANNCGTKSFKDSMLNLNNSSRKISDSYLHTQIRKKEILPNSVQVDFSNDLDSLIGEIIRMS